MADAQRAVVITKIGDLVEIDACLEESHSLANTVTDHPVEEGSNISDHSRPNPDVVTLRCFVSNTPLSSTQVRRSVRSGDVSFETSAAAEAAPSPSDITGRGQNAYLKLKKMRDDGQLVDVVTSLRTYSTSDTEGMMIESLTIPRTRDNFDGLEFSMTLKQVRIVRNRQTTQQKQKDKQTRKKQTTGQKIPENVDYGPPQRKKTALRTGVVKLGGS